MLMLQPKSARLFAGIIGLSKCMLHPATPSQPYNAGTVVGLWRFRARRFWLRDATLDYYWNLIGMPVGGY